MSDDDIPTQEQYTRTSMAIAPVVEDPDQIVHYLCSVTVEGEPVDGQNFARAAGEMLTKLGVMPIMSTCYVSRYPINPFTHTVKDIWTKLCAAGTERSVFAHHYPELTTSLDILCGITPDMIADDPNVEDSTNGRPVMGERRTGPDSNGRSFDPDDTLEI